MPEPESGIVLVNSALNFVNLALTAWIIRQQQSAKTEVKRTARTTRRCSKRVTKVENETHSQLARIVELLTGAFGRPLKTKTGGKAPRSRSTPKATSRRGRK